MKYFRQVNHLGSGLLSNQKNCHHPILNIINPESSSEDSKTCCRSRELLIIRGAQNSMNKILVWTWQQISFKEFTSKSILHVKSFLH